MWICQKCNTQNTANFCMNCGAAAGNAQTAPDLPPTVIGVPPIPAPNQFQNQKNFGVQNQPTVSAAPKKSGLLKILLIGGIVGLLVVGATGFLLYDKVAAPYLEAYSYEQNTIKKGQENQSKAKAMTAKELLPESITSSTSQTVNRGQMIDKSQLLEAAKKELPPVYSDINNVNDAAAGIYATADKREAILQVFKYNSPEQAQNACERIGQEMIKKKNNFVEEPQIVLKDVRFGDCVILGETKNGQYVGVKSLYGFLYVSSGHKDFALSLYLKVLFKLTQ